MKPRFSLSEEAPKIYRAMAVTERERSALALTEAVTFVHDGHVTDEVYEVAARHFDQPELAALVWGITAINAWNRAAIASRSVPGTYRPELAR